MIERFGFAPSEAIMVGTQGHTAAQAFGKIMAITKPRQAVCYHFQNDFDISPLVRDAIRETYDGPLDLAVDFMVWNVTKKDIRTRMAVPNEESFPAPPQREKEPPNSMEAYQWDPVNFEMVEPESARVTNELIARFNKEYGTEIKPSLTGAPFKDKK